MDDIHVFVPKTNFKISMWELPEHEYFVKDNFIKKFTIVHLTLCRYVYVNNSISLI